MLLAMNVWVFIYRLAGSLLAGILLIGILYIFYPPIRKFNELQRKESKLEEEIRFENEMLRHLKTKQEKLMNNPRFVERIAREELGYAKPGETVFKFTDEESTNARVAP
jgi:hypothetical protein